MFYYAANYKYGCWPADLPGEKPAFNKIIKPYGFSPSPPRRPRADMKCVMRGPWGRPMAVSPWEASVMSFAAAPAGGG